MESDRWINAPYAFNKIGRQLVAGGFSGNDYNVRHRLAREPPTRCPQERDQGLQGSADVRAGDDQPVVAGAVAAGVKAVGRGCAR